ncbi:MAG TPA: deoxyguanosinetriphosphate triphosphohydrolase [Jiangellales bacterium]|nr:deoxyguanosinetriphosphate triphosphohydrolase [Jiangellales bacterium]
MSGYGPYDEERWLPEPAKRPGRSAFERDRARVVHSAGLRRLAAKTQVVGPGTDDFVRNRLTHSLEVAQVGRELGKALGCDPDVVDAACLAHDLGHPPFGHNGEQALDEVAAPCGGFEGNAQTLRLLTRLEPKVVDPAGGRGAGLNLTRAGLDAATKYPWEKAPDRPKYGVYAEDREVFGWLRSGAPAGRRCLEAQVMDFADDVAYSVHDVEDAVVGGRLDLGGHLDDPDERARVAELVRGWYLPDRTDDEVLLHLDLLRAEPSWVPSYDGSRRTLAALKDMTSQLIGRFCAAAEHATRRAFGGGRLTRYTADLAVPRSTRTEVAVLKGLAAVYVMTAEDRQPVYERQREQVLALADRLLAGAPGTLEPALRQDWAQAGDDAARLRVVVDQVASLTDASAVTLLRRLSG